MTKKEVEEFLRTVWPKEDVEIEVESMKNGKIEVSIFAMYDAPGLSFAQLMTISEKFGTKQIDAKEKISSGGCETCDYGSAYGFVLTIEPEKES